MSQMSNTEEMESVGFHRHHSHNMDHSNNIFGFENTVGLNIGMSGDTSDSSDADNASSIGLDKPFGLVGLQNIGNTCYMNAALQALSNTLPLTNFFLECSAVVLLLSEGRKPGLSRIYQMLLRDIWIKKKYGYVNPSGVLYGIRNVHAIFRGYHQHDTQEFLRNFMDQLHEELKQLSVVNLANDLDVYNIPMDDVSVNSSFESSEGEYETCDSGVSERSSLSDETERLSEVTKRRLTSTSSTSPNHRLRTPFSNSIMESQSSNTYTLSYKKQVKYRSIISDIFDGKLLSSVQCLTCNRISSRIETFQDLSLPIPSRDHLTVLHGRVNEYGLTTAALAEAVLAPQSGWISWLVSWLRSWIYGPTVSLHDCLAAFFSTDELKGDNMYSCERCNKLRNGIKFSKVLQLPEVLCIHLKRFRHELMFSSKISSYVSFPLKGLDVRPYLHADCTSNVSMFELFSVICHHGTAGGGHYTCFSLNGNQWYEFDDQYVTKVSAETVESSEAYVLFYRKNTSVAHSIKARASEIAEMCNNSPEESYFVSKQWLSRFKTCAEPGPIDNSDFLCHHNLISPERCRNLPQLAVVLPKQVYDYLLKKFGGCQPLNNINVCTICQTLHKRVTFEFETFLKLNNAFLNQRLSSTHLLSTNWFNQWQNFIQKHSFEPPGPIDNSRMPSGMSNDFIEINREMWIFFYNIYGGGPELPLFPNKLTHGAVEDTTLCNGGVSLHSGDADGAALVKHSSGKGHKQSYHVKSENLECKSTKSDGVLDNSGANSKFNGDGGSADLSSMSSTETDEDTTQEDGNFTKGKKITKASNDKLYYRTKTRRFRYKNVYKNKYLGSNSNKSFKHKGFC